MILSSLFANTCTRIISTPISADGTTFIGGPTVKTVLSSIVDVLDKLNNNPLVAMTTTLLTETIQVRQVNNIVGGRDVAFFNMYGRVALDQNDYVFLQVRNRTDTANVTVEDGSRFTIEES